MGKVKNTYKAPAKKKSKKSASKPSIKIFKDRRIHVSFAFLMIAACFFLLVSFISYLFTGKVDQSIIESLGQIDLDESGREVENWFGLMGAFTAHKFIFEWFGIASFLIPPLFFLIGYFILFKKELVSTSKTVAFVFFFLLWTSAVFGFLTLEHEQVEFLQYLSGAMGYEIAVMLNNLFGWGTFIVLVLGIFIFIVFFFNVNLSLDWISVGKTRPREVSKSDEELQEQEEWVNTANPISEGLEIESNIESKVETSLEVENLPVDEPVQELEIEVPTPKKQENAEKEPSFSIDQSKEEKPANEIENYDPTLDLGSYRFPSIDLLKDYEVGRVKVTKDELEQNKNKIVETLTNFKIGISSIKATIGPTVTLYEIIPDAGVKISKIKNLEDDIALSLAALGIRIIAPIPGKGTIGIEVPNKNREMVSIRSVISTEKFSKSTYELPVVLGITISNEVYVTDLSKMPHLLMAGATGQGKSVGLNVLLASLIYKKHPSQLKFVLVDPKKVELTLYNKIERHFLAKLPDSEEAIVTENKKVIYTLNSLCIEMDDRLSLLKDAACRNLKEYNKKFVERRLSPEKGHRYLPYIVLVIDELADLMVTSGKEVETPIARLAAVARAIGIHLVLATQRPSVNVITGVIKANFPARMSFRVTSKIDSRTILDMGGAEQLVGMGDMLFSLGSELVRLQCPFADTDEVENVCEFVGSQRGYETAYVLPEFSGDDESGTAGAVDLSDRDSMFEEAARLIVRHQQGSTSLIQRKLKLGYNRAGRLIDQLEAAGIVGPFEGSKAREVLINDEYSLEQKLNDIYDNN